MRARNLVPVLLAALVWVRAAEANPVFAESPATVDAITRGIDDAFQCAAKYVTASDMATCDVTALGARAKPGLDQRAYAVGFCFEAWRDLDVEWVSDQQLQKRGQSPAANVVDDERETGAMYRLYRNARDKLGITDTKLLALSTMNPAGKAKTSGRLQYWATRAR